MLDQTFPLPKLIKFYSVVVARTDNWFWLMLIFLCSHRSRLCGEERRRRKNVGHELKMLFFSPSSAIVAIDTANRQLSPGRRWIEYSWKSQMNSIRRSTPVIQQYSANSSAIRVVESTHGAFIELQLEIAENWTAHIPLVCWDEIAARSGRNWFRIAAIDRRALERNSSSLSLRTTCARYLDLALIDLALNWNFHGSISKSISVYASDSITSISKNELRLRRYGEKYFIKRETRN